MHVVNVGMDLAITSDHWATVVDAKGETLLAPRRVARSSRGLEGLWRQVQEVAQGARVRVVVEPTGMAWLPVAVFFWKQGAEVLRPSSAEAADLRRFLRRHAKSDRVDTRVLARLPLVKPEGVPALQIPNPRLQALERLCKQRQRLVDQAAAIGKRIRTLVELAMPGITELFPDPVGPAARAVYGKCANPWRARSLGQAGLEELLIPHTAKGEARPLAAAVLRVAEEAIALYCSPEGDVAVGLDHDLLQVEINVELSVLDALEREIPLLERHVQALYQELHPEDNLQSIPGVGKHSAPIFLSSAGSVERFPSSRQFRSYLGMVPRSRESGGMTSKGLRMTKAGKPLGRRYAYIAGDVARRYDPQIAACYYDQMVHKGKHHRQAVCICGAKVVDRVFTVLREGRPYVLRDVDGTPVTADQARALIHERYTVPQEVRRRRRWRGRKRREGTEQVYQNLSAASREFLHSRAERCVAARGERGAGAIAEAMSQTQLIGRGSLNKGRARA
jgi:transposase